MARAKKPITRKQFVINNLRMVSRKWPAINEARNKAKLAYNTYVCQKCFNKFPNKYVRVDHKVPVVDPIIGFPMTPEGMEDWSVYIPRLFCDVDNLELLCEDCHNLKSGIEQEIRKLNRKPRAKSPKKSKKSST